MAVKYYLYLKGCIGVLPYTKDELDYVLFLILWNKLQFCCSPQLAYIKININRINLLCNICKKQRKITLFNI